MRFFIAQRRVLISIAIAAAIIGMPLVAGAQSSTGVSTFPTSQGVSTAPSSSGQPTNCGTGGCSVNNPLQVTSICGLLQKLFQAAVAIGIPVAVLFVVWSGFKFVFALGNPKELGKAKQNFYYTIIGIAIFLGAWVLATAIAATVNAIGGSNLISCQ